MPHYGLGVSFVLSHLAAGARADAVTWRGPPLRLPLPDRWRHGRRVVRVRHHFRCGARLDFAIPRSALISTLRNVVGRSSSALQPDPSCRRRGSWGPGRFVAGATQSWLWRGTDVSNPLSYSGESNCQCSSTVCWVSVPPASEVTAE